MRDPFFLGFTLMMITWASGVFALLADIFLCLTYELYKIQLVKIPD